MSWNVVVKMLDQEGRNVQHKYEVKCHDYDTAHEVYAFYKTKNFILVEPPREVSNKLPIRNISELNLEDWKTAI